MNQKTTTLSSKWMKACIAGWFAGIALILILSSSFEGLGISNMQFFLGVGMGAGIGFAQWLVLKKAAGISKVWIGYSMLGLGLPFLIFDLLKIYTALSMGSYYILLSICIAGLLAGLLQYLILKKHASNAAMWIVRSFAGWTFSALTVFAVDYTKYVSSNNWVLFSLNLVLILSGGFVLGFVTKGFMSRNLIANAKV